MDNEFIDCLPFQCTTNDELLSLFYEEPLKFECYYNKKINPFTEPAEYNKSYAPEVNFDQLLTLKVFLFSSNLKSNEGLTCLNFNIMSLPKHYD